MAAPRGHRRLKTIHAKLSRLVLASLGSALLFASIIGIWHEADRFLRVKQETMLATAQVFGAAASAATAERDAAGVGQALRGITRIPGLLYAEVHDRDGRPLGGIGSAVRLASDLDIGDRAAPASLRALLMADSVSVSTAIINGGEVVGRLTLITQSDLLSQVSTLLAYACAVSIVALLLGLMLARRLQHSITQPIDGLARAMGEIARTGAYGRIAIEAPDEETARLTLSFNHMISEIDRATNKILARENEIIARLSLAGELRDDQTGQHVFRVARITRILGETMRLDPSFVEDLCRASPMHDVGKISIPDAILHKPGRLTPEERSEMERHALRGYEILSGSDSELVRLAAEIALSHHERWDGKGYPNRLAGSAIPVSGRLTAVADVCDALFSERPYKEPWPAEKVRQHFIDNAGTHFDPTCVAALIASWPRVAAIYARETDAASEPVREKAA